MRLKPAHEVWHQLLHDEQLSDALAGQEVLVGYHDRFLGVLECTLEDFEAEGIPFHRVRHYRAGCLVWSREERLNNIGAIKARGVAAVLASEQACAAHETLLEPAVLVPASPETPPCLAGPEGMAHATAAVLAGEQACAAEEALPDPEVYLPGTADVASDQAGSEGTEPGPAQARQAEDTPLGPAVPVLVVPPGLVDPEGMAPLVAGVQASLAGRALPKPADLGLGLPGVPAGQTGSGTGVDAPGRQRTQESTNDASPACLGPAERRGASSHQQCDPAAQPALLAA